MIDECSQVSGEYCESDGNISKSECSNVFFSCSEGIAHRRNCPANLVFNPAISSCDWPKNVMDCSEKSEKPQNCGEVDGYFSFGRCSSSFSACTNGIPIVMFCPDGLMFSEKNQMCDYEWNVDECDLESSGFMENYKASEALTPCTNMDNGLYALDCTPRVLSCQNGRENIFECPPSLVFNENSLICDYPETSLKCCMEGNSDSKLQLNKTIFQTHCSFVMPPLEHTTAPSTGSSQVLYAPVTTTNAPTASSSHTNVLIRMLFSLQVLPNAWILHF